MLTMSNNLNELIRKLEMPDVFDSLPTIPYSDLLTTESGLHVNITQENSDYFSGTAVLFSQNYQNVFDLQIVQKNQFLDGKPHGVGLKHDEDPGEFIYARRFEHGILTDEILNEQYLRLTHEGFLEAWNYPPVETYNTCYLTSEARRCRFSGESVRTMGKYEKYKHTYSWITSVSNGLKSGNERIFYPNGVLQISRNYRDNILHGLYECFSENGALLLQTTFINGYTNLDHFPDSGSGRCSSKSFDQFLLDHIFKIENPKYKSLRRFYEIDNIPF